MNLFRQRWHQRAFDRLIGRLLHIANSNPPWPRETFYAMKSSILSRFGLCVGQDVQHIVKKCWGDRYDCNGNPLYKCEGGHCRRCGGTGIFQQKWVYLSRWELGGVVFHRPDRTAYIEPEEEPTITGHIEHRSYGRLSFEAACTLALLFDRRLLWALLTRNGHYLGWYWHPWCNLARVVNNADSFIRRFTAHTCFCGRRWRHWFESTGWCVCRKCRQKQRQEYPYGVPF